MSTLARDFGAEYPAGRQAWVKASLRWWLANAHPALVGDVADAYACAMTALETDIAGLLRDADWAAIVRAGRSLRRED